MLTLTQRDKNVIKFIEENRAITTTQATQIFFNGLTVSAIRRLNQLEDDKILESYMVGKSKVYKLPETKELSQHDLLILDFYAWVYANGGQVTDFKKTPRYFKGLLIPDALLKIDLPHNGDVYEVTILLEIDYTHYTPETKLNTWYEKLYREEVLKSYCSDFPLVIIARPTKGLRYNSKNFEVLYTDLRFTNLIQLMF